MLSGHSLVYFAPGPWAGLWRNRQQLMSLFARCNRVLYVEPRPYLRPTLAAWRSGQLPLADLRRPLIRQVAGNLFVFHYPFWAPVSGRWPLEPVTRLVRRQVLGQTWRRLGLSRPITWFSHPDMVDLPAEIPPTGLRIYHLVDEYTGYADQTPESRRRLEEREQQMMAHVDLVIVVSQKLYQTRRPFKEQTYLAPNGVNYQAYTEALADPTLPEALVKITPPRLGYSGLIGDRLNLSLLDKVAQAHPEWSLVFLGEARVFHQAETWQRLLARPNVYYLGEVDISQVPHYLKGLQVGLMPYALNRETENISPLKLYDYLAAGLPIVSTDIPAAREFGAHLYLADDAAAIAKSVRAALSSLTPGQREARREIARQHSWEARVEQLSGIIEAHLGQR